MRQLILILFIGFCALHAFAQKYVDTENEFALLSAYPRTVTDVKLDSVITLADMYSRYPSSWVKDYLAVEIAIKKGGAVVTAHGNSDTLTSEQLVMLRSADLYSDVEVKVSYIPDNTLSIREEKLIEFDVTIVPGHHSVFGSGYEEVMEYVKQKAKQTSGYEWTDTSHYTVVAFTVDEEGQVVDAKIKDSTASDSVRSAVLETICKMPAWYSAESKTGEKVAEEFLVTVGNDIGYCRIVSLQF